MTEDKSLLGKGHTHDPNRYKIGNYPAKGREHYSITRRKIIYFNKTRQIRCINCQDSLKESWVVSSPRKNRCVVCAKKKNVLTDGAMKFCIDHNLFECWEIEHEPRKWREVIK